MGFSIALTKSVYYLSVTITNNIYTQFIKRNGLFWPTVLEVSVNELTSLLLGLLGGYALGGLCDITKPLMSWPRNKRVNSFKWTFSVT